MKEIEQERIKEMDFDIGMPDSVVRLASDYADENKQAFEFVEGMKAIETESGTRWVEIYYLNQRTRSLRTESVSWDTLEGKD